MWAKYEEPKEVVVVEEPTERKANFRSVFVTEVTPNLHVFCQYAEKTEKLEKMMDEVTSTCLLASFVGHVVDAITQAKYLIIWTMDFLNGLISSLFSSH